MQFVKVDETIKLNGILTMDTITKALVTDFLHLLTNNQINSLDLSEVIQADSACVSLLLCAKRTALHKQQSLTLHHLPSSTKALIKLYELENIIKSS